MGKSFKLALKQNS